MSRQFTREFLLEVSKGKIPGHRFEHKFGQNPDIDADAVFHDIWDDGPNGDYTFWDNTTAQNMEVVSTSANDSGSIVTSGTATGGSYTTIEDTGATFITSGVAVGDIVLNTTNNNFAIVTAVTSETVLTVYDTRNSSRIAEEFTSGDSYSVVNANSTGAAVVQVYGLDGNFDEIEESVIMNGTTAVAMTQTFIRVFRQIVLIAGSNMTNVGDITCRISGVGTTAAKILANNGQTLMAIYTVPDGHSAFIVQYQTSMGGTTKATVVETRGVIRNYLGAYQVKEAAAIIGDGSSTYEYPFRIPLSLPERTDIKAIAKSDTANTTISTKFTLVIIDNNYIR